MVFLNIIVMKFCKYSNHYKHVLVRGYFSVMLGCPGIEKPTLSPNFHEHLILTKSVFAVKSKGNLTLVNCRYFDIIWCLLSK